jgi:hypothetical protein
MKSLKLKNYFFIGSPELRSIGFHDWLAGQMLHGQVSRARTRFLQSIAPRVAEIDNVRLELLKKYAEKRIVEQEDKKVELPVMTYVNKETGEELDTTDANLGKRFKIADVDGFNKEYQDYLNEDYVIDVTPANKDIIYGVRDLLLNSHEEFSGRMALLYDEFCNAFESIREDKEEEKVDKKSKK